MDLTIEEGFALLKRCDTLLNSRNKMVDPVFLNNTTETVINNQITEVKENHKLTRKRTFKNISVTEDCNQGEVKNKIEVNNNEVDKKQLLSIDKPPKIKKKLNKDILGNILKSNDCDNLGDLKINCSQVIKSTDPSVHMDTSTIKNIGTSDPNYLFNTNNIPFTYSRDNNYDVVTEPILSFIDMPIEEITTSSELPVSISTMSNNIVSYENDQLPPDLILNSNYSFPIGSENDESFHGLAILSDAIIRQSREAIEESDKIKSSEQDLNEVKSPSKMANSSQVPISTSATALCEKIVITVSNNIPKVSQEYSQLYNLSVGNDDLNLYLEPQLNLISKRFNIRIGELRKTVVDEPLALLNEKYCSKITPSMLTISPMVKVEETQRNDGNLDVIYKIDPIIDTAAYEKTNLKDIMEELSKTMTSWNLSIIPNPQRYVISNMSTDMYGVPIANKVIILDRSFIASVYINQIIDHTYTKPYTSAAEIINLIKDLNAI